MEGEGREDSYETVKTICEATLKTIEEWKEVIASTNFVKE